MDGIKAAYKVYYRFWLRNPRNDDLIEIDTHMIIDDHDEAINIARGDADQLIKAKNRKDTPDNQMFIEVAGCGFNIEDLVYFRIQIAKHIAYDNTALIEHDKTAKS